MELVQRAARTVVSKRAGALGVVIFLAAWCLLQLERPCVAGTDLATVEPQQEEALGATFVSNPEAQICVGSSNCKSPREWLKAGTSGIWHEYARPSTHWNEDDGSPFAKCCYSCNMNPTCSWRYLHHVYACNMTSQCSNSEGEEHVFVNSVLPYLTQYGREHEHIFLEVGGNDGLYQSNTIFVERCLRWKGISIEAHPILASKLRNNRPGLVSIWSALCDTHTVVNFSLEQRTDAAIVSEPSADQAVWSTPCAPLSDYLKLLGVTYITYFVLDVEGFEDLILAGIDFSRLDVGIFVVEELWLSQPKNKNVRARFKELGYRLVFRLCRSTRHYYKKVCDAFFINPRWVDIDALQRHVDSNNELREEMLTQYQIVNDKCLTKILGKR